MYFSYDHNFTIFCSILESPFVEYRDCSEYIIAPIYIPDSLSYSGAFLSNYIVNSDTRNTVFDLDIVITDPSYNVSDEAIVMSALDSEYDNYNMYLEDLDGTPTPFERSAFEKNQYHLGQPQNDRITYLWSFSRTIRNTMIPNILSYLGRPTYKRMPYIESNIEPLPFPAAYFNNIFANSNNISITNVSYYGRVRFFPGTPITKEETEQRNKTVLSLLGILGGIWSALTAFYIFLFGLGLISPWGFVQRSRPFKRQYQQSLLNSQSDKSNEKEYLITEEPENLSIQKRLDDLEKRVERLERINNYYREYIIDTSFITSIKSDSSLLDTA
ncbi:4446_t:CDS:2, partial [Cetraspora pellucida]